MSALIARDHAAVEAERDVVLRVTSDEAMNRQLVLKAVYQAVKTLYPTMNRESVARGSA